MARLYDYALQRVLDARLVEVQGHNSGFFDYVRESLEATPTAAKSVIESGAFSSLDELTNSFLQDQFLDSSNLLENYHKKPVLDGAEVFLVNNVAKYYVDHARHLDLKDIVPTFAPPFEKFWIEYETGLDLPPISGQNKVGILFNAYDHSRWLDEEGDEAKRWKESLKSDPENWRWSIEAFIYIGLSNNRVAGPVGCWRFFVSEDGSLFKETLDLPLLEIFKNFDDPFEDVGTALGIDLAELVRPALLAIGFLHCKNVEKIEHIGEKKGFSHQRKKSKLIKNKYYTLDIEPMKRVLSRDGDIENSGIKHALHICRGHFKNFTPEAPLLGRATGTYWFSSHVRGSKERGVVKKDYSVGSPTEDAVAMGIDKIGLDWQTLNEEAQFSVYPQDTVRDSTKGERGLNAHSALCNQLADYLKSIGHDPRRPKSSEPQFDLAWETEDRLWVIEAKSLTDENEVSQLRTALGQIQCYGYHLRQEYSNKEIRMGILVEREPNQEDWQLIFSELSVELIWPDRLTDGFLSCL